MAGLPANSQTSQGPLAELSLDSSFIDRTILLYTTFFTCSHTHRINSQSITLMNQIIMKDVSQDSVVKLLKSLKMSKTLVKICILAMVCETIDYNKLKQLLRNHMDKCFPQKNLETPKESPSLIGGVLQNNKTRHRKLYKWVQLMYKYYLTSPQQDLISYGFLRGLSQPGSLQKYTSRLHVNSNLAIFKVDPQDILTEITLLAYKQSVFRWNIYSADELHLDKAETFDFEFKREGEEVDEEKHEETLCQLEKIQTEKNEGGEKEAPEYCFEEEDDEEDNFGMSELFELRQNSASISLKNHRSNNTFSLKSSSRDNLDVPSSPLTKRKMSKAEIQDYILEIDSCSVEDIFEVQEGIEELYGYKDQRDSSPTNQSYQKAKKSSQDTQSLFVYGLERKKIVQNKPELERIHETVEKMLVPSVAFDVFYTGSEVEKALKDPEWINFIRGLGVKIPSIRKSDTSGENSRNDSPPNRHQEQRVTTGNITFNINPQSMSSSQLILFGTKAQIALAKKNYYQLHIWKRIICFTKTHDCNVLLLELLEVLFSNQTNREPKARLEDSFRPIKRLSPNKHIQNYQKPSVQDQDSLYDQPQLMTTVSSNERIYEPKPTFGEDTTERQQYEISEKVILKELVSVAIVNKRIRLIVDNILSV